MNARDERQRVKREAGVRVQRHRWDLEANPSFEERRLILASGDMVAAQSEQRGGRLIFHGLYLPRQVIPGGEALAVVCKHDHDSIAEALDCAGLLGTVMPIHIVPEAVAES